MGCGWGFQLELKDERGVVSLSRFKLFKVLLPMEAMRCSLALRDAFVSRANLGIEVGGFEVDGGVESWPWPGRGDSAGGVLRLWLSLARTDRGAPRPMGFLVYLLSVETDVGRSSKDSNSVPSPKLRRFVGLVRVRFPDGEMVSVLVSPKLKRCPSERLERESRENVPVGLKRSLDPSELVRREDL
jgi:hypothetical protein